MVAVGRMIDLAIEDRPENPATAEEATSEPGDRGRRPLDGRRAVLIVVTGWCALSAASSAMIFDDWRAACLATLVGPAAFVASLRRLPGEVRTVLHVAVALVELVVVAVVTGGRFPSALTRGLSAGLSDVLSVSWPAPMDAPIVVGVGVVIAVASSLASELAFRPGARGVLLIPPFLLTAVLVALAAPRGTPAPGAVIAWGVGALVVLAVSGPSHGTFGTSRGQFGRGQGLFGGTLRHICASSATVGVVAVAALVGLGVALVMPWVATDRTDPRAGRSAKVDELMGLESLAGVATQRNEPDPVPLIRITGSSAGAWRLFALDQFDGIDWGIGGRFRQVGRRLDGSGAGSDIGTGQPEISVEIQALTKPLGWLPISGVPHLVPHGALAGSDHSMVLLSPPLAPGTSITATFGRSVELSDQALATARIGRPTDDNAASFRTSALRLGGNASGPTGDGLPLASALRRIEQALRADYRLAPQGPVLTSIGAIHAVLESSRQGPEEQFVAGFVLLARSLGANARVAIGYRPEPGHDTVTTADVHAWPEVWFDRYGWVSFDPVPQTPAGIDPPVADPSGAAAPTPLVPPDPAGQPVQPRTSGDERPTPTTGLDGTRRHRWRGAIFTVIAISVLAVFGAAAATLLAKQRRRKHRLRVGDPGDRIVGAWAEATDTLVDFGAEFLPSQPNVDIAQRAGHLLGADGSVPAMTLAGLANATVYAATPPDDLTAALAVRLLAQVEEAVRSGRARVDRVRARLSLRSFLRRSRSPVR